MGLAGGSDMERRQALAPQAECWAAGGGESYRERKPQQPGKMVAVPEKDHIEIKSCPLDIFPEPQF